MSDYEYRNALQASERRLSNLRATNRESVGKLETQLFDEQSQHAIRMSQKEKKHEEHMLQLSNSSFAERKAAEDSHKKSIEELKQSHKNEKAKLEEQLASIKQKGEQDVKEAEQQRASLEQQRSEALVSHYETMRVVNETLHSETKKEREEQHMLKMNEMNEKSKRMAIEHQSLMATIENTQKMQKGIEISNASLAIIKKLMYSIENVNTMTDFLNEIRSMCVDKDQDYSPLEIKTLKYYTGEIEKTKSIINFQMQQFKSFICVETDSDPKVVEGCMKMATKMSRCMESSELRLACTKLPTLAANKDHARIGEVLKKIESLTNSMVAIKEETENNSIGWIQLGTSSVDTSSKAIQN